MRVFIAADVSPSSSEAIVKLQKELVSVSGWNDKDVKAVAGQNFHFTMLFLGEKSEDDIERIKEKLSMLEFEPFTIKYTGIGGFPNPSHARVIWLGVDYEGGRKLEALAKDVVGKLADLGPSFQPDKPFSPHLTVFRVRRREGHLKLEKDMLIAYENKIIGTDVIDRVQIKRSDLTTTGPIYSNICAIGATRIGADSKSM